jgi:hypothetical protein
MAAPRKMSRPTKNAARTSGRTGSGGSAMDINFRAKPEEVGDTTVTRGF